MSYNSKQLKVQSSAKKLPKPKDVIYDPMGQWKFPGQITKIPSGNITMQGVPYPVLGKDNLGNEIMMQTDKNYQFPGTSVTEYPQFQKGGDYNMLGYAMHHPIGALKHFINPEKYHATDEYKKPNHITFSDESKYSNQEHKGGHWEKQNNGTWTFTPSSWNIKNAEGYDKLQDWWSQNEGKSGNILLPPSDDPQIKLGGWLNSYEEEYKKGGQKGLRQFTSKNIQTSLNDIMQRNTTLFGSSGKKRYKPDLNYKYGGWLDQYQGGNQVNTSNWKKSSKDSFNLYNRGEEMVKWAKENPNFTTLEHNKKDDELNIKYPVSSMPWSGKNSFIGATNWATLNSTKSGYWGVPLYDKPVGVQKEIKQQLVVSPPVVPPFVIPAPVAVPKVQTEYVIRENNFGPPIKYRINRDTKQYYPITDIPKNTPQSDITTIPFVNEMKKYGGWLDQYQDGSQTKANPLLIQAFQQSLANQKINEQKVIDAKNQEIKNNPLGIKTLTTARDNTNVVPIRQQTTLSNIEADKKRNEADKLLKQQKKTQGTLRETPKEINPNEAWRLAASNYQGHDKEEMNRIINSSKTVEGLGALAGVTGGGLHALASIPVVANTLGLGFAAHGVHSLPSTYRTLVDPNESVYNKARALTYNTADFLGMKQATEALKGVGTAGKWAYNSAARSVATSKESGLLSRAHELNPYAFKPNPEAYYRGIGRTGLDDALESKIIRPTKNYDDLYVTDDIRHTNMYASDKGTSVGDPFATDDSWRFIEAKDPKKYIAEIPKDKLTTAKRVSEAVYPDSAPYYTTKDFPSIDDVKIYKQDWLQGYKQVEVPKQLPGSPSVFKIPTVPKTLNSNLYLKSIMDDGAISKIVEPKTGLVNTEQALAIIGKESGGAEKVALVRKGLGENLPLKMDYNKFKKTVQDQLISLEKQFSTRRSDYGIKDLGYTPLNQGATRFERFQNFMNTPVDKSFKKPELLENQTLILSNKGKFGSGSDAHGNPEETLGHIHFLRDAEHPDILIATQIQSDAFQGTHRIMPKTFNKEQELRGLSMMEDKLKARELDYGKAKKLPNGDYKFDDGLVMDKTLYEQGLTVQREMNAMKKADIESYTQKSLLDKNHQERYLQEFIDYAGKRGDVNYIAIPTSETAAKVQGYKPMYKDEKEVISYIEELKKNPEKYKSEIENTTPEDLKFLNDILAGKKTGAIFDKEQQTILKKYSEYEKIAKKLGWEVEDITIKGNTYKKIKIPKSFKGGKGQIKAFKQGGQKSGWLDQYQDGGGPIKYETILGDNGKPMLNIQPEVEIIDNKYKSPLLIGTKSSFINSNGLDNVWDKVKQQWVVPPKYPGLQPQLTESKSKIPTRVEEMPSKRIINPLTEIYKPVAESTGVPVNNAATINKKLDAAEMSKLAPFIAAEKRNQEATAVARYRNEQARANGTATGLYDETNEVRKYLYQQDKKKADEDRTAVMMAGLALAPAALYIAGVPAVSTALATGFGAHGVYSIPNTYRNWVAAADPNNETTWGDALGTTALNALDFWGTGQVLKQGSRLYNTVATGQSALPIAWKSQAVGLSQEASQKMFNSLVNSGKLTDAERALIVEYQHHSRAFTGRGVPVNLEKQQALNNIINKYNLSVGENTLLTRRFNPDNNSLGATLENGRLNFGNRPTSFSAGIGIDGYNSGAVNRLVIPSKYVQKMSGNFLANEYGNLSDDALNLMSNETKEFSKWIGDKKSIINAEKEVIGTGLDFKKIGKVKNDIGGHDWIVRPSKQVPKQLPGSPNVTSSVNDVFPITLTTPNSGYKFPKVSPDAKSIAIHESNKFVDANWKARNNIETFFKNNNIDVATLPQSKMVSSKVGYDYVLPEGVTHDMLNEYARLHHSKFPISEEFKQVGETIRKLNPDAKINPISSHSIHGVASNIHPDFNGKLGQGLEVPKQLPGSPNAVEKIKNIEKPSWILHEPQTNSLQIKSTMLGSPLEKQLSKSGEISISNLKTHIGKAEVGQQDKFIIDKVLNEKFAGKTKIDYNDFRKAVSEELVPLERNTDPTYGGQGHSNWGVKELGYPAAKKHSYEQVIEHGKSQIKSLENEIAFFNSELNGRLNSNQLKQINRPYIQNIQNELDVVKNKYAQNLAEYEMLPLENKSITYNNRLKFGKGSAEHFDESTLGHARTLVSKEEPDVMHILEQQSDYYQKGKKTNLKILEDPLMKERNIQRLNNLEKSAKEDIELAKNMRYHYENQIPDSQGNLIHKSQVEQFENMANSKLKTLNFKKADLLNPEQKKFLGNAHQERLLQENTLYAVEQGKSKMRYPTFETAAKIQKYQKINLSYDQIPEFKHVAEKMKYADANLSNAAAQKEAQEAYMQYIKEKEVNPEKFFNYFPEHQTILKKYNEMPKMIKKVLGKDVKIVTDFKGNTWYEFNIPEKYKLGKAEIKAFKQGGTIKKVLKKDVNHNEKSKFVNSQNSNWLNKYQ